MAGTSSVGRAHRITLLVGALLVLAGAAAASQFSGFMDAYQNALAGRVVEARMDVDAIVDRARHANMPVYALLHAQHTASNPASKREAEDMRARIDSAGQVTQAYDRVQAAGILEVPVVFVSNFRMDVAEDAWSRFEPAVPRDTASVLYAVMGGLLALAVFLLLRGGVGLLRRLAWRHDRATA